MNTDLLINACKQKNIAYQYTPTMFGISFQKNIWHWFTHFHGRLLRFDHTNSLKTGLEKKGIKQGLKVVMKIKDKTGCNVNELDL